MVLRKNVEADVSPVRATYLACYGEVAVCAPESGPAGEGTAKQGGDFGSTNTPVYLSSTASQLHAS